MAVFGIVGEKRVNRIDGVNTLGRREGLLMLLFCPAFSLFLLAGTLLLGSLPSLCIYSPPTFLFIGAPLGLCPLMLRSLLGLSLRLPQVFLFVSSPLGLGLQTLDLGELPGFVLLHSSALFQRHPWLIQRFDNLSTEVPDLLADERRIDILITQGSPIDILAFSDS